MTDALALARCGLLVAAGVVPASMALAVANRRLRRPVVPPWKALTTPWTGFDVLLLFGAVLIAPAVAAEGLAASGFYAWVYGPGFPAAEPGAGAAAAGAAAAAAYHDQHGDLQTVRGLWAALVAFPFQIGMVVVLRRALYPAWRPPALAAAEVPARLVLAGRAWLVLTPVVFVVHLAAVYCIGLLGSAPEDHPLAKIGPGRPAIDRALFVLQACVFAPWIEEALCRGLLLPWAVRRAYRPWLVLAAVGLLSVPWLGAAGGSHRWSTFAFLAVLAAVWALATWKRRPPRGAAALRRRGGVYASAALFAALHAAVWPTPVPLFAFGLGLGWLALATRGVLAPVVVHGLFNAVSVAFVLSR